MRVYLTVLPERMWEELHVMHGNWWPCELARPILSGIHGDCRERCHRAEAHSVLYPRKHWVRTIDARNSAGVEWRLSSVYCAATTDRIALWRFGLPAAWQYLVFKIFRRTDARKRLQASFITFCMFCKIRLFANFQTFIRSHTLPRQVFEIWIMKVTLERRSTCDLAHTGQLQAIMSRFNSSKQDESWNTNVWPSSHPPLSDK